MRVDTENREGLANRVLANQLIAVVGASGFQV